MSIQEDRKMSLTKGRFSRLEEVYCDWLEHAYIQRYYYSNTQGRLLREKPLQSILRRLKPIRETLRMLFIKNKRIFV